MMYVSVRLGEKVYLPCIGAADNLDARWLKSKFRAEREVWTTDLGDSVKPVRINVRGDPKLQNASALRVSNFTTTADITMFTCLVMNQQQCVSSQPVLLLPRPKIIYHTVEDAAVLPCTVADSTDDRPPHWFDLHQRNDPGQQNRTLTPVDQNYSLLFSSLMFNHSGVYCCQTSMTMQTYLLLVCPRFGPPALELFSGGENVTLRCRDFEEGVEHFWFIKSNQTEDKTVSLTSLVSMSTVSWFPNGSLVISNVSMEHTGEYWCAVMNQNEQCVSTSKTVLKYRDPYGIYSTFYVVRCSVLSVLLVMLCVTVITVNRRTRTGEQL
ncbi:hypothetical protein ABVT39_004875 [Epinephelus coioides]